MHKQDSPACLCGARHWRIETLPDGGNWVGHCQDCGAERRWPTREPDTRAFRHYAVPQAHAPAQSSRIAIKPSAVERTW